MECNTVDYKKQPIKGQVKLSDCSLTMPVVYPGYCTGESPVFDDCLAIPLAAYERLIIESLIGYTPPWLRALHAECIDIFGNSSGSLEFSLS